MGLLEDIEAIKQLKAEYCYALDENRIEDLAELFAPDAVCDFQPYFGVARGRDAIRDKFREVEGDRPPGSPLAIHVVTNPLIRVEGDFASGKWYLLDCIIRPTERRPLRIIARYDEEYRRVNGEWKIQHEKIILFHADVDDVELSGRETTFRAKGCFWMRSRLDLELARRGIAASREAAQRLIMAGYVRVNSQPAAKPDLKVTADAAIELVGLRDEYASRGAYKLIAALDHFDLDVCGRHALDVGASTGGFTDVLLRRGAAHVVALDVGYGQLVERLRRDPRITVMDRVNIRHVRADDLPYRPDLVVVDVSFISLKIVLPAIASIISVQADIVTLIKPQFEVGRGLVGKGGIVRDSELRLSAATSVIDFAKKLGLRSRGIIESPIRGAKGNCELLAALHTSPKVTS